MITLIAKNVPRSISRPFLISGIHPVSDSFDDQFRRFHQRDGGPGASPAAIPKCQAGVGRCREDAAHRWQQKVAAYNVLQLQHKGHDILENPLDSGLGLERAIGLLM